MYHSKKIGVFISHIFGHYQKNVCQGIIDKALEYGYTVEVFTSLDGENLDSFGVDDESILRIPNYDSLDGVIFASETYLSAELRQKIRTKLENMCTCPIIEIAVNDHHFPNVYFDNNANAKELTLHMIHVHHYKRICYLGCSLEPFFSQKRESFYKEALQENQITYHVHDTYNCDYSKDSALAALSYFCEEGTPNAVICYNDRLALNFMEAALSKGYRIPEDIAVTGFDNSIDGQNISPMLTTVSFPVYELGITAVEKLISQIRDNDVSDTTTFAAESIFRNSCGCCTNTNNNPVFFAQELSRKISGLESSIFDSMNMSAALQHVTDIDDAMDLLEKLIHQMGFFQEFYLCLYSDWDSVSSHILELTDLEESDTGNNSVMLKLAIKNGKRLPECTYQKKYPLPEYVYETSDCAYLYSPLYFGDKEFGYTAIGFEKNQIAYRFHLIQWQLNMNHMLQSIYESRRTGLLISKLEDIYMRDSLTGLLNKNGYNYYKNIFLNQTSFEQKPISVLLFDMNGLKSINDTYGHSEGDFAIQVIGHALESTIDKDDICARFNNDEFYILSPGKSREEAEEFIETIYKYLDNYNNLSSKKYSVTCSCGYASTVPDKEFNSDTILKLFAEAEKMMYENKSDKKYRG